MSDLTHIPSSQTMTGSSPSVAPPPAKKTKTTAVTIQGQLLPQLDMADLFAGTNVEVVVKSSANSEESQTFSYANSNFRGSYLLLSSNLPVTHLKASRLIVGMIVTSRDRISCERGRYSTKWDSLMHSRTRDGQTSHCLICNSTSSSARPHLSPRSLAPDTSSIR